MVLGFTPKTRVTTAETEPLGELVVNAIRRSKQYATVTGQLELRELLGQSTLDKALACEEVTCLAEIAGALGVDRIVAGSLSRWGRTYLINLRLVDQQSETLVEGVSRKFSGASDMLLHAVPQAVAQLIGVAAPARLMPGLATQPIRLIPVTVTTLPPGAQVTVDGTVAGESPVKREVREGIHTFAATAEHHQPAELSQRILNPETIVLELELTDEIQRLQTDTDWITVRASVGTYGAGGELLLGTLRWAYVDWTLVRAGATGGFPMSEQGRFADTKANDNKDGVTATWHAGSSVAVPVFLDVPSAHELRFGVGAFYGGLLYPQYWGTSTGIYQVGEILGHGVSVAPEVSYVHHFWPGFSFHVSLSAFLLFILDTETTDKPDRVIFDHKVEMEDFPFPSLQIGIGLGM